jgi:hypothetical protein
MSLHAAGERLERTEARIRVVEIAGRVARDRAFGG